MWSLHIMAHRPTVSSPVSKTVRVHATRLLILVFLSKPIPLELDVVMIKTINFIVCLVVQKKTVMKNSYLTKQ